MRQVSFYKTSSGQSPIHDFFDALPAKILQKVTWTLELIEQMEYIPREYFKKLSGTEELWEVRVEMSGKSIRLLCFFDGGVIIVLASGFFKKTDKIPRREITLAEQRRREYFQRKEQ